MRCLKFYLFVVIFNWFLKIINVENVLTGLKSFLEKLYFLSSLILWSIRSHQRQPLTSSSCLSRNHQCIGEFLFYSPIPSTNTDAMCNQPTKGHLDCLQCFAIINDAVMNFLIETYHFPHMLSISVRYSTGSKITEAKEWTILILKGIP